MGTVYYLITSVTELMGQQRVGMPLDLLLKAVTQIIGRRKINGDLIFLQFFIFVFDWLLVI